MKTSHKMANEAAVNRPARRFYSAELKTQVMQECRQNGASVAGAAGVALSHSINVNSVKRGLREHNQSALVVQPQSFVPVMLDEAAPAITPQTAPDIRVQVQRANTTSVVKWPLQGATSRAAWLRGLLR